MADLNDFFSFKNTVQKISDQDRVQTTYYLEAIKAFARVTHKSVYVIDYNKKGFEFVSDNPIFLCGHTAEEVRDMGYDFYFKYVIKEDVDLLVKINQIGFDLYETMPMEDRIKYSISYDFHLINPDGKTILINQKLTPLFLNSEGKVWKALCLVSLSSADQAGNIQVFKNGTEKVFEYNLKEDYWEASKPIELSEREKEILQLSYRGFTLNEISEKLFISTNTIKYHRKKIFEKLEVHSITDAIAIASTNSLI